MTEIYSSKILLNCSWLPAAHVPHYFQYAVSQLCPSYIRSGRSKCFNSDSGFQPHSALLYLWNTNGDACLISCLSKTLFSFSGVTQAGLRLCCPCRHAPSLHVGLCKRHTATLWPSQTPFPFIRSTVALDEERGKPWGLIFQTKTL